MIDLHLHLDGSLTPEELLLLAQKAGVILPVDTPQVLCSLVTASGTPATLNEYLKCFELPLTVLQSAETVAEAVRLLACRLAAQGLLYAELRFAPQLHLQHGCTQVEIVEGALEGIRQSGFWAQLILCCMRGDKNEAENFETVRVAQRFLGQGVAAIDLAGAEALYPTHAFASVFALARKSEVPFTIHAGEAAGADSVQAALDFGAQRIGHGIRAAERPELLDALCERNVTLEMCPTSNFQTGACARVAEYPLRQCLSAGVPVAICTDNMTVSHTTLKQELSFARDMLGMTAGEVDGLLLNAAHAAFLDKTERTRLIRLLQNRKLADRKFTPLE